MKKIAFYVLILLVNIYANAQSTEFFEAEYRVNYNTDNPQVRKGVLQLSLIDKQAEFSISEPIKNIQNSEPIISDDGYGVTYKINHPSEKSFIRLDFNRGKVLSKKIHRSNSYFVVDNLSKFSWKVDYSDQKEIGSLVCKKATVNFRGRKYIAWYSTEIPISYGPYKFHGLPDLIIQIHDETFRYSWTLISYNTLKDKPKLTNIDNLSPVITAQKYYSEIRYISDNEKQKRVQSKLPKGVNVISVSTDANVRKGIEIKFEWEEK